MSAGELTKAVILARGLGTRMRRQDQSSALEAAQTRMADTGLKAMIPVGRPFLDYVLSGLADAGYREVCLVIGPEHGVVRDYYEKTCIPRRLRVSFAIQEHPLGTADALAAAQAFTGGEHFLLLNSDNYYPVAACRALLVLGEPAVVGFESQSLSAQSNIPPERIRQFAAIVTRGDGTLADIIEKPGEEVMRRLGTEIFVSMNCWCFGPAIFRACAAITPSPRGELELTDAVQFAIGSLGERFRVLKFHAGVLDLSSRGDITAVREWLGGVEVSL
jgi:glucose-1-phosphate thymidylyltransferase